MGRRFGIELEVWTPANASFYSPLQYTADLLTRNNISVATRNYRQNRAHTNWSVKPDASIGGSRGAEVVSPPLKDARGRQQVADVIDVLYANGFETPTRCGIHVHVDTRDLTNAEVAAVVYRWHAFEQNRIAPNLPAHRRTNRAYCPMLSNEWAEDAWRVISGQQDRFFNCMSTRYSSVNLQRRHDLGTIEFRIHESTLEKARILSWIAFCVFFVNATVEKMRAARTENEALTIRTPIANPFRYGSKNWQCFRAVSAQPTTPAELAALTGWQMSAISSMISYIRQQGITVERQGSGSNITYFVPPRVHQDTRSATQITRTELVGNLEDGLPEQAMAWFDGTAATVAA